MRYTESAGGKEPLSRKAPMSEFTALIFLALASEVVKVNPDNYRKAPR